ncbi:DDB1- and CUL4-associated factor 17-like [Liolophura sinensis]|uniref:DDB1- and CUL4-associated factor 17-like n=1 Tax=Liolophura sinensis TaxID=3198878 RepID=UPI00315994D5
MGDSSSPKELDILQALTSREYGNNKSCYRSNLNILRNLVCKSNFVYRKVWEKQSNKSISCEGGRIYFNNFRECYSGYTRTLGPKLSYQLPVSFPYEKIEDALVCQTAQQEQGLSWKPHVHRNSLFGITRDSVLVRFDIQTGEVLESIHLPNRFCFRNLSWETEGHSLSVKSIHLESYDDIVLVLALYDVCRFSFVAMMEVTKSVFGRQVRDASLSQGLLITMHITGVVKNLQFY